MLRKVAGALALPLAAAACAGLQKDNDPTPLNPTVLLETHQASSGLQDSPAFEGSTTAWLRPNMQRAESKVKGAGTVTQFLNVDSGVRIERLDRKIAWTLDAKNQRALECPIKGCQVAAPKKAPATRPADGDKPHEGNCRLRIGTTAVTVNATGQKRGVNGFDTELYDVKWVVTLRDNASRRSTSTITMEVWTTPTTPDLRDAAAIEGAFYRARDKLLGIDTESKRASLLPAEAARAISGYLAPSVSPSDRASLLAGARRLDKVKGVPVLTTVRWSLAGEACAMDESPATAKEGGDKPLFTFLSEVKSRRIESRHDSMFVPPKDYKITK